MFIIPWDRAAALHRMVYYKYTQQAAEKGEARVATSRDGACLE
mgnify:CR=1 FL=1